MNLQGFSPDSFEQLIRTVALKVFGPGVTVFGNGPDGGREATFNGRVGYPAPPSSQWDGYGVVQAKFKEKLEDPARDQTWAEKQLKQELDKWVESSKRTPKPEYFVFCTNVVLSSAAGGGKDSIRSLLLYYAKQLSLKDFAIWDGVQIIAYTDSYEEIRKRFYCFLTPGDLLAQLAAKLGGSTDPESVLSAFVCKELIADEDARLSQAGDRSEDRIRLAQVFLDLPVGNASSADTGEEPSPERNEQGSLSTLLRVSTHKLDPFALRERRTTSDQNRDQQAPLFGRYVFLGGPGSGKSTIGQFLAQVNRAAILSRRPEHRLEYKVLRIISDIKNRLAEEGASLPATPRYPFRIELNAFAKSLDPSSRSPSTTLSDYIRKNISSDVPLTHDQLRLWLKEFPCILILDGLDEVPASSNRKEVITSIQSFLNEARDVEADIMIVASSRPDGYAGEFDGEEVAHRYLAPLPKAKALACARRYLAAKNAGKQDRREEESMAIIQDAIENPLIAKLMRSPLQVTFMVTVVAASGKPSDSRWQLFNDYYRTIYERELHKAVRPFDKVLNERRQDIDALHHHIGFILQCRGESSGGTHTTLSILEFRSLVRSCLAENGLSEPHASEQLEMIVGAASQRLVFLTSRTPGQLSFDVRSLQEYMAAACLTNTDSNEIFKRLEIIAPSAYWRNTLLFAIGRFFVEPQVRGHRDRIRIFCQDLGKKNQIESVTFLGSRIALEIIESGTIGNVPLMIRSLTDCSLSLLSSPYDTESGLLERLANIYDAEAELEFRHSLDVWLGQADVKRALPAWLVLLQLEKNGIAWARAKAIELWPTQQDEAFIILSAWIRFLKKDDDGAVTLDEPDTQRLGLILFHLSVISARKIIPSIRELRGTSSPSLLQALSVLREKDETSVELLIDGEKSGISLRLCLSHDVSGTLNDVIEEPKGAFHFQWKIVFAIHELARVPSAGNLLVVLRYIVDQPITEWTEWGALSPWPVASVLGFVRTKEQLTGLIVDIDTSYRNEVDQWLSSRYTLTGEMDLEKICLPVFLNGPALGHAIHTVSVTTLSTEIATRAALRILGHIELTSDQALKKKLSWILCFFASCTEAWSSISPARISQQLLPLRERWWDHDFQVSTAVVESNPGPWLDLLDAVGRMDSLSCSGYVNHPDTVPLSILIRAISADLTRFGLIKLAGFWCSTGREATEAPSLDLMLGANPPPEFLLGVILIQISRPSLTKLEADGISRLVPKVIGTADGSNATILTRALNNHVGKAYVEVILTALLKAIPLDRWKLQGKLRTINHRIIEGRPSGLEKGVLLSLGLPQIIDIVPSQ